MLTYTKNIFSLKDTLRSLRTRIVLVYDTVLYRYGYIFVCKMAVYWSITQTLKNG